MGNEEKKKNVSINQSCGGSGRQEVLCAWENETEKR